MKKRTKELCINLVVFLVTIVLLIAFLEWVLRFSGIERIESRTPHLHQSSSVPGVNYEFVPNLKNVRGYNWERISTNNLGFRGQEFDPSKPTIAIIGDSFAFGFGVNDDENHPALLQKKYPSYNVLNLGVNGYNIEQEVRAYLAKFPTLKPSLVIVEFVFNDMDEASILTSDRRQEVYGAEGYREKGAVEDAKLRNAITKTGTISIPFKLFLQQHSAIFNFLEHRTKWLPFRTHANDWLTESITQDDLAFYDTWFNKLASSPGVKNTQKIFVVWPEASLHLESRAHLYALAKKNGFHVLDLYDVFGMEYPHLSWDWHPNANAHAKVAEILSQFIAHEHLLPKNP